MACVDCGTDCVLIDAECLCRYTPLKGFDFTDYMDVVEDANSSLLKATVCDLCDDFGDPGYLYQAIIDDARFRRYYAKLIYFHWLVGYGNGKASENGVISKASDEFSEYRVHTQKEITPRINRLQDQIADAEEKFLEFFLESFPNCVEGGSSENCGECGNKECCCPTAKVYKGSSHSIFGLDGNYYDCDLDDFGSF